MNGFESSFFVLFVLVGFVVFFNALVRSYFDRFNIPSLLAFVLIGILLSWTDGTWSWMTESMRMELEFLGKLGLVALLFRVGLDSDIAGLLHQLPRAVVIWLGNMVVSALAGFGVCSYIIGTDFLTAVIVAVALSATSVGVTAQVWEESGELNSTAGELFVDVAELDDISAVLLMALLFVALPELRTGGKLDLIKLVGLFGDFLFRAVLFTTGCVIFSLYLEETLTNYMNKLRPETGPLFTMVGLGFVIAALAGLLGFSLAIGALFAGVVFSRDPVMIRQEASFSVLYEFFSPFFFLVIGLNVTPAFASIPVLVTILLLAAAVLGKLLGTGLTAYLVSDTNTALLLGVSMIPRGEITLLVVKRALERGSWAVSKPLYGAMVFVALGCCLLGSLGMQPLLSGD